MSGQAFSHYRVLSQLGSGGMGVVYRAEDLTLGREVALKLLPAAVAHNRQAIERFLREARAAAALNHPNICTIYEAGELEGQPYIVMELLDGQTLQQYLANAVPSIAHMLDIATQVAGGLAAAHAKGITHRDIKPANIFVAHDGRIKVLDFGLAKLRSGIAGQSHHEADTLTFLPGEQLTGDGTLVGTVAYMSPEQARGEALDTRTDLFSFGVVLYEMSTGRLPFAGATWAVIVNGILSQDPIPASTLAPNLPPDLDAIIGRALEKDRDQRYQDALEIQSDLRAVARLVESGSASGRGPSSVARPTELAASTLRRNSSVGSPTLHVIQDYLERFPDLGGQILNARHYVWPAASVQDSSTGEELSSDQVAPLLRRLLEEDANAFVLLLGDYGSGKTSFMRMFGNELAAEALKGGADALIPMYLSLGFAQNKSDLLEAMSAYLLRYGVSLSMAQLKSLLLRRGNVVLLLDGFDEMASGVDYRIVPEILERIHSLQIATGVRIILSGRSSFFRSDIEVGIVGAGYVVRLRAFDLEAMLTYINLRDSRLTSRAAALFGKHDNLRELCRNPIHLMLFVNWLGAADSPLRRVATASSQSLQPPVAADLEDVSVVDLYKRFFMKTLQDNFGTITKWSLDQRWEFVRRLACDWFKEGINEWPLRDFSSRIEAELPGLSRDEVDAYTLQLLNCTFFTRVGDRFRFLHQSYLEYLVSEALCKALWGRDLTIWDMSLYTDIFEMTYRLLAAEGFERIPVEWVMQTGTVRAQANFLAMSFRHKPAAMEVHLRQQLRHNPHDIVRFLAAMGIGLYAVVPENVDCVEAAFQAEQNTIVRAMIQRVASNWLSETNHPVFLDRLQAVAGTEFALRTEDAERATLQRTGSQRDAERALFAFRRAMIQGDNMWTAAVGGILSLAMVQHLSSFSYIYNVAAVSKHPEIRNAYRLVQRSTALPDLPPG
jgi:serine/threonine protein kinase